MKKLSIAAATTAVALASLSTHGIAQDPSAIKHVLLLSIDGMHAVDFYNCSNGISGVNGGEPYCPNLANLSHRGTTYSAASTTRPSDSFPGMMTLVTGATPRTMGVYYDVAYDRSLDAPAKTTGNGNLAGPCTAGAAPTGTTTEYEEGIDIDQTKLNGGAPGAGLTDGGVKSIDPQKLIRNPALGCAPVFPWNFIRTNTVFGVIHQAGGYTAWSDKHPAYSSVGGPGGPFLDDFYAPEINSNVVALPGVKTPEGASCATVRDPGADLTAWTNSFDNIQCYDTLKVNAILNEIAGKTHNGGAGKVPALFGMNFQAVSVGQKLIEANVATGGYTNAEGVPTQELLKEIEYVDASIGQMVTALKDTGNLEDTVIIVTAKHGQSPIDPNLYKATPGKTSNGTSPATLLAAMLPASESPTGGGIGPTEDDVSLLWLANGADVTTAVSTLEENKAAIGLGQIYYGPSVALNYNKPGLGAGLDPRAPDIIVTPNVGVTYTGSAAKLAEHGGFAHDDTNVMLVVSNPGFAKVSVSIPIATAQVAPTILQLLGLNPNLLNAVQQEGTAVLPGIKPAQ